jgi:hypothetical protein
MKRPKQFDLQEFLKLLEKNDISYLLIGRWAVILHGAPLMTADYDFWIDPSCRQKLLRLLEKEGFEVPNRSFWKQPILSIFAGFEKIDFFFDRKITNQEGQILIYEEVRKRADVKEDKKQGLLVVIPSIDDLIALKKIKRSTLEEQAKDEVDIRTLRRIKALPRNRKDR